MQRTIKVKNRIIFSVVFIIISLLIVIYLSEFTVLEPKSKEGVQLVARSVVDFRSTTSYVYVRYPGQIKLKKNRCGVHGR